MELTLAVEDVDGLVVPSLHHLLLLLGFDQVHNPGFFLSLVPDTGLLVVVNLISEVNVIQVKARMVRSCTLVEDIVCFFPSKVLRRQLKKQELSADKSPAKAAFRTKSVKMARPPHS